MKEPRILHLTIKKKWFDMIASGEKKEEYRELKDYWHRRLVADMLLFQIPIFKKFDIVRFTNGYGSNAPTVDLKFVKISIEKTGRPEWGFQKRCFVIFLGEILNQTSNQ
jgi:hypothetical protein